MFDQVNGLPVHALVIHAAVVFIPLLAVGAIVYALVSRWRTRIGWAVGLLAIISPITALVSMLSGEALLDKLKANGLKGRGAEILNDHMGFGTLTFWFTLVLGIVTLAMVVLTTRRPDRPLPKIPNAVLSVVVVLLALTSGYYAFRTGDSGATAVWGTY